MVAAISSGSGIFATHFIAMLAFEPSIPSAYDSGLTVLSLVFAIGLTGLGLRIALSETPRASWLGGGRGRLRHRRDALHRHGGLRGHGTSALGSGLRVRVDPHR
ncbi:hypothetical protein FV232_02325 [Methylobacterium sp. WL30]|nr:hypothetical protein FV225_20100 [Methylobacterium sp. WL93]TXN52075.1 hypothetical protein FV227_04715 [Methylobacterium sp. WL119]TXN70391.1 hypothetical protein FV232_02325 [Methylobacterium sp. WL30]